MVLLTWPFGPCPITADRAFSESFPGFTRFC